MSFLSPLAQQGLSSFAPPNLMPVADQQTADHPLITQTLQQYPVLRNLGLKFKMSPGAGGSNMLESWPAGETGTKDKPRPKEFDNKKLGIEIYSDKTRPIDILGDVVSHHLVNEDPVIKKVYDTFQKSMTPQQQEILKEQYIHAKANEGEKRPFEEWKASTGIPAYFRGYAFQQWSQQANQHLYTPQQRLMFDQMMLYLQGKK